MVVDRQIDKVICIAPISRKSLGASVAKKMCFQRSSKRIEGESRLLKPGWKVIPQSTTGSRETPVAKFVVCSWHDQLPDVIGMRPQRATTSIREKMTVVRVVAVILAVTTSLSSSPETKFLMAKLTFQVS